MPQMIRLVTFFFFVHFVPFSTDASTKVVDSLLIYQAQLKNTQQPREKIKLYYKLSEYLSISRSQLAAIYLEKGHRLSKKTKSTAGLAWYYKIKAYQALSSGDYQQGIYQSDRAAYFSLKNHDTINFLESNYYKSFGYFVNNQVYLAKKTIFSAFQVIHYKGFYKQQGMLYSILGHAEKETNLVRSFEYMQMSYRAHMKAHNTAALYTIYSDLSAFYDNIADYREALYYSKKALASLANSHSVNYFDLATVQMNIGYCYDRLNQHPQAIKYLSAAIHSAEKIKSSYIIERCLLYKADIFLQSNNQQQTVIIANQLLATSTNSLNRLNANFLLARSAFQTGQFSKCGFFLDQVAAILNTGNGMDQKGQIDYYQLLSNYHQQLGNFQQAFVAMQKLSSLKIKQLENQKDYRLIKAQLTLNKREKIFANQKAQLQQLKYQALVDRHRLEKVMYTLLVSLLIVFLLVEIRGIYRYKKQNKQLRDLTIILESLVDEKEVLLKEVHHRVKNNFQIITSMLSIQSRKKQNNLPDFIQQFSARIHSMAYIHDQLYQQKDLNDINAQQFITDLLTNIRTSFQASAKNITCSMNESDVLLPIQVLISIGLIINELATNSFKHAFAGKHAGKITLFLQQNEHELQLRYADNGRGMDDLSHKNAGLIIVEAFVRKLHGTIDVTNANGFQLTISIPLNKGL